MKIELGLNGEKFEIDAIGHIPHFNLQQQTHLAAAYQICFTKVQEEVINFMHAVSGSQWGAGRKALPNPHKT